MKGKNLALIEQMAKKALAQVEELKAMLTEICPSGIKYLKNEGYCPAMYYSYFVGKTDIAPITQNELKRRFLLYHIFEQLPPGCEEPPVIQRLRNNKMSAEEARILEQARIFKERHQDYGIEIIDPFYEFNYAYNDYVRLTDFADALIYYHGEPAILRLEVTSGLKSTFKKPDGDYGWGNFYLRDHMMAYLMMIALDDIKQEQNQFVYWVADYKSRALDFDVMEVLRSGLRLEETKTAIRNAYAIIKTYREKHKWKPIGDYEHCKNCPRIHCEERVDIKPVKEIHTTINYYTK